MGQRLVDWLTGFGLISGKMTGDFNSNYVHYSAAYKRTNYISTIVNLVLYKMFPFFFFSYLFIYLYMYVFIYQAVCQSCNLV